MSLSEQLIETHWPLTEVSLGQVLQEFGERNATLVTAKEGRFVVKISDQWRSDEVATKHAFLFDFLQGKGFAHVPRILKTKTGENYQQVDGQPVIVMAFIPGQQPVRTPAYCRRVGEITASLHAVRGYPHSYLFTVADVMPELYEISKGLSFGPAYAEIVSTLPSFEELPRVLIHGEILGNCIEQPDGKLVIVDWDEAGIGTRILDVGHPLIQVALSEDLEFEEENARAFYEGYFSRLTLEGMMLEEAEIDHIFDAALFYALRYIIYGDTNKRWQRIQFAVENRAWFESVIRG